MKLSVFKTRKISKNIVVFLDMMCLFRCFVGKYLLLVKGGKIIKIDHVCNSVPGHNLVGRTKGHVLSYQKNVGKSLRGENTVLVMIAPYESSE